uniref:hypothetical protein n=1 Tax=Ruegeria lacuscaerulensis TaxID=55218 RepID=UPI00147ED0C3
MDTDIYWASLTTSAMSQVPEYAGLDQCVAGHTEIAEANQLVEKHIARSFCFGLMSLKNSSLIERQAADSIL